MNGVVSVDKLTKYLVAEKSRVRASFELILQALAALDPECKMTIISRWDSVSSITDLASIYTTEDDLSKALGALKAWIDEANEAE